jgi:lipid-binding SYLF domain-containing protein
LKEENMFKYIRLLGVFFVMVFAGAIIMGPQPVTAATAAEIDSDVNLALQKLYDRTPAAREILKVAKGILVFPSIVKGSFIIGARRSGGERLDS